MPTIESTELDFENIKRELTKYFKASDVFKDYDFEASGLSSLLDVLAYNTHFNALIANFSLNESYLGSAQLRSSVVSIANLLGYTVRSMTTSSAVISVSFDAVDGSPIPVEATLPAGTKFTASVNDAVYDFYTLEEYRTIVREGTYYFENISIHEGRQATKTFIATGDTQMFIIPDANMDVGTAVVSVYDNFNSTDFVTYENIANARSIEPLSRYYKISESPNGFFEMEFGDGRNMGTRPVSGNKIVVSYLSTSGELANDAVTFTSSDYNIDRVVSKSSGGSPKQSIESIKYNAPLAFASQKRLITPEDYESSIRTNYSYINDVSAWGGEENDPPQYGKVFASLIFDGDNVEEQDRIKINIVESLARNLGILSIDMEFVEPIITRLEFNTSFGINRAETNVLRSVLENNVREEVKSYVESIVRFKSTFRKSNLLARIDDSDRAILHSDVRVRLQQRIQSSTSNDYRLIFPVSISHPENTDNVLTSSPFVYNGVQCEFRSRANTNKIDLINVEGEDVERGVGYFDHIAGVVNIVGVGNSIRATEIKISVLPLNDNTMTLVRNNKFQVDDEENRARVL